LKISQFSIFNLADLIHIDCHYEYENIQLSSNQT
jgi:hypothetical protein